MQDKANKDEVRTLECFIVAPREGEYERELSVQTQLTLTPAKGRVTIIAPTEGVTPLSPQAFKAIREAMASLATTKKKGQTIKVRVRDIKVRDVLVEHASLSAAEAMRIIVAVAHVIALIEDQLTTA